MSAKRHGASKLKAARKRGVLPGLERASGSTAAVKVDEPVAKISRLEQVLSEMSPEHASVVAAAFMHVNVGMLNKSPLPSSKTLSKYTSEDSKKALAAVEAARLECAKVRNPFGGGGDLNAVTAALYQEEGRFVKVLKELYS